MSVHGARRRFIVDEYVPIARVAILTKGERLEPPHGEIVDAAARSETGTNPGSTPGHHWEMPLVMANALRLTNFGA